MNLVQKTLTGYAQDIEHSSSAGIKPGHSHHFKPPTVRLFHWSNQHVLS